MKVAILVLAVVAVAYGSPAVREHWNYVPRMPMMVPKSEEYPFPHAIHPKYTPGDRFGVDSRIVNGQEAVPHAWPHQVALYIDNTYFCGGTLIYTDTVLTAGHCTTGAQSIEVVLGAHNLRQAEASQIRITTTDIYTHEEYGPLFLANDVGLVRLGQNVPTSDEIQPLALPQAGDPAPNVGDLVTPTGWGVTKDPPNTGVSDTLNQVTDPVLSNAACAAVYGSTITDATICTDTSNGNKGTCSGDSGGPLHYTGPNGVLTSVGVTSFVASAGCESGSPDGFTRTASYLDWINQHRYA